MSMPTDQTASPTLSSPAPASQDSSFEAVVRELAEPIGKQEDLSEALLRAGARLLFCMNTPDGDEGTAYVAAVAVGDDECRRLLIVNRPASGPATVESVETSESPLARLAPSFAAVMERWPVAA